MKQIRLAHNTTIAACPVCGNNTDFELHVAQMNEDCIEGWVVCKCGFDPTSKSIGSRCEAAIGAPEVDFTASALGCWNDTIQAGDA